MSDSETPVCVLLSIVQGKNKKLYMDFDQIPSREVTGGAFHQGHEMDVAFIRDMSNVCLQYITKQVCTFDFDS